MSRRLSTTVVAAIALLATCPMGAQTQVPNERTIAVVSQQVPRIRVGGGITAPRKIKNVDPVYPDDAKAAGVEGPVILEIVVNTKGLVSEIRVLNSIPLLDAAAIQAVWQWQYTPTL